jgi:hypothetical protein
MILINKYSGQIITDNIIKSSEIIVLQPLERRLIELPICKDLQPGEFVYFQQNIELLYNGVFVVWNNFNELDSNESIKLFLLNINQNNQQDLNNPMTNLFGSRNKIVLKPETILGEIFILKNV